MNKTLAIALLVSAVAACDPFLEDCNTKADLPRRAMGAYWLHGVMSFIQATYMFAIMGAYVDGLSVFGPIIEGSAFAVAGLNFITYLPNAIIWALTTGKVEDTKMYRHYYRSLKAVNIIGWFVWLINMAVFLVLVAFILVDGLASSLTEDNATMPSFIIPTVGFTLDFIFQIMYAVTYGYNRTLMRCWGWDFPELGGCAGFSDL